MKRTVLIVSALISVFLISGCGTTGKFIYPDDIAQLVKMDSNKSHPASVAILPFEDCRKNKNRTMFMMYMIPLLPYGWGDYNRPDAANMFLTINKYDVTPSEDLAKATAMSLRHSKLFENSYFTMGGEKKNADFLLSGEIKEMKYEGKMFSYCLSIFGPILWYVGAPAGVSENKIGVALRLTDKKGTELWSYSFDKEDSVVQWLYAGIGDDCIKFSSLYQKAMNEAIRDLSKEMNRNPGKFKVSK